VFTGGVPGEGGGGLIHVDIRGIIFIIKTVMNKKSIYLLDVRVYILYLINSSPLWLSYNYLNFLA